VFSYRVITGAIIVAGSVFASGLFAGHALAQYEPVGKPLQLVPPSYSSKSAATPRSRVSAKKAAKSETKSETRSASSQSEAKSETKQHVSLRRKHRTHTEMAEQKRLQRAAVAAAGDAPAGQAAAKPAAPPRTPATPSTASPSAPSAAPATMAAAHPLAPQAAQPAPPTTGELVIGGQAVQVRSPDEANELDLAANEPSAPAPASDKPAAPSAGTPLYNLAGPNLAAASEAAPVGNAAPIGSVVPPAATAALAAEMGSARAEVAPPKGSIGSASWIMQIMAALGGAAAAGSAAWFLIGSASPRIKLSEWQEADEEG
jgi:hypothetical protein